MIKIHVKQTIVINLPAEVIFAYMSNLEKMVDWSSGVISVKMISPRAMSVGTRAKSTIQFLGLWSEMTLEIVECTPNHSLMIKSVSGVNPCLFSYQFEPLEDGGTSVAQDAVFSLIGGCIGLSERVIVNAVRRYLEHDLLTLKDMLETSTPTSRSAARA